MNGYDGKRDQSTPGKLPFGLIVILSVIGLLIGVGLYYAFRPTYTVVNSGDGKIYKVNKRTGETVLVKNNREYPVENQSNKSQVRDLSDSERGNLTGSAYLKWSGSSIEGTLYNGNSNVTVTSIRLQLEYESGKTRQYECSCYVAPFTSGTLFENILDENENVKGWTIVGAKGRDVN